MQKYLNCISKHTIGRKWYIITIETSSEIVEYGVDNEVKEIKVPLNHNMCLDIYSVKYDLAF